VVPKPWVGREREKKGWTSAQALMRDADLADHRYVEAHEAGESHLLSGRVGGGKGGG